jgi:hypothetical protein
VSFERHPQPRFLLGTVFFADALQLPPHGEWHASGDRVPHEHDAQLFHGFRWYSAWPLLVMPGCMFVVLRRFSMISRFVGS